MANELSIKDFIISDVPATVDKPKAKRNKPTIEFEVVLSSGIDGIVRRKTKTTSKLLVLLMSQRQFYIKNERSGEMEELNRKSLGTFLQGVPGGIEPVPWCTELGQGLPLAEGFIEMIGDDLFCQLAKGGYTKYDYTSSHNMSAYGLAHRFDDVDMSFFKSTWNAITQVMDDRNVDDLRRMVVSDGREIGTTQETSRAYDALFSEFTKLMLKKFGLDWTRKFAVEYMVSPYVGKLPDEWCVRNLFDGYNYDPGRFTDYVLHESVKQGFGSINNNSDRYQFFHQWTDVLHMQVQTKGKVFDKYPDDLEGLHRKLSFKCELLRHFGNEEMFTRRFNKLKKHAKEDSHYIIRPPFNGEDMVDEAQMQSNCLASYVDTYSNGYTDIYFLRKKDEPDRSLVTVEVKDGRIRQAYRANNMVPSKREIQWLNEWAKENGFEGVPSSYHPMCA